ncbi:hypothetical protein MAIT1_05181 [Magnetofaba australis IT-1]|uniref:DNA polymerase III subunit delta n=1 Tax=Magnetofaba australis IT-1 TaxID=1434232 RepID=A0A1Y2K6F9_9PROT|nr:hypothetical protein [Magnetofaba australis]OSM05241.1 hypothetical protein MAIT1_05181 [Magnetofaba australis IT-1]
MSATLYDAIGGHAPQLRRLQAAQAADRLPHALLLSGPPSVGKRMSAIALAQSLLCHNPLMRANDCAVACGVCAGCRKVAADTHPDFRRVEKQEGRTQILVEQVRDLIHDIALSPLEGGGASPWWMTLRR